MGVDFMQALMNPTASHSDRTRPLASYGSLFTRASGPPVSAAFVYRSPEKVLQGLTFRNGPGTDDTEADFHWSCKDGCPVADLNAVTAICRRAPNCDPRPNGTTIPNPADLADAAYHSIAAARIELAVALAYRFTAYTCPLLHSLQAPKDFVRSRKDYMSLATARRSCRTLAPGRILRKT